MEYYIIVGGTIAEIVEGSEPSQEELQRWADDEGEPVYVIRGQHAGLSAEPQEENKTEPTKG